MKRVDWELLSYCLIVLLVLSLFTFIILKGKYNDLEDDYCWLNLHTYEYFLDGESSNSTTIGDIFMYMDFKTLRDFCKREGYHPNRFTEGIRNLNERGTDK